MMTLEITCTETEFYEMMRESALGRDWVTWHNRNPQFFTLFERFTNEAISRGHNNLSGWLIANRVRWETNIVTRGNEYKIKNDFIALFARLFMVRHQQYIGFFRTKRMKRLKRDVFKPKAPIDD
jgi:hypothetical protein|tara:strand:+ start:867 stop:1238 length:372 start_codon:yes stop_codon:yes gene_type:complete